MVVGELLLDRANFTTMTKYIGNTVNLKLMMNLLRDSSRNIQFEAFHVFKVFWASRRWLVGWLAGWLVSEDGGEVVAPGVRL